MTDEWFFPKRQSERICNKEKKKILKILAWYRKKQLPLQRQIQTTNN